MIRIFLDRQVSMIEMTLPIIGDAMDLKYCCISITMRAHLDGRGFAFRML
jgi:hypothetical protein